MPSYPAEQMPVVVEIAELQRLTSREDLRDYAEDVAIIATELSRRAAAIKRLNDNKARLADMYHDTVAQLVAQLDRLTELLVESDQSTAIANLIALRTQTQNGSTE